jgi:DNA polymerase
VVLCVLSLRFAVKSFLSKTPYMPSHKVLSIDIETFSPVDLTSSGVFKYAEDPDFTILLLAYAYDNDSVRIIDLASGEALPDALLNDLSDPSVIKTAYNASFEIACLNSFLITRLNPSQWECTMVRAAVSGLPLSLDAAATVLKLDQQKMSVGRALIRYFSMPVKPVKSNGFRTRNLPFHDPEKWELFKEYCRQDVETERAVRSAISHIVILPEEKQLWFLDQEINARGILIDQEFVANAIRIYESSQVRLLEEASDLTGLANPNSPAQLKAWLNDNDQDISSLSRSNLVNLLGTSETPDVTRAIELRLEMAKSSVKKYEAMQAAVCSDGRIRGLLQFYAANRTGRWAGRLVQVQNLPQNHLNDLDLARQLVKSNDGELFELAFGSVSDTLSQLIRTAFIAGEGKHFIVADFSAIEARVIAWLAGEQWRMDVFNSHGKIYEASASQMFRVPIEKVTKGSELRQKGKIAELACGYQGGVRALKSMGALEMGVPENELQSIINRWRKANPNIVQLWNDVSEKAMDATESLNLVPFRFGMSLLHSKDSLIINLPSSRQLFFRNARIIKNASGNAVLAYDGMNQTTKTWETVETYGGKLVENIVQAIARDCLAESMLSLDAAGYRIVMHVHDEVVIETDGSKGSLADVIAIMSRPISWAKGLPLKADGYETYYYKKD